MEMENSPVDTTGVRGEAQIDKNPYPNPNDGGQMPVKADNPIACPTGEEY